MKKVLFLTILFLAGFVAGVVTMEILSRPAQHVRAYRETLRAYRERLQSSFVISQSQLAYKAFKEGNDLKAMVHLWTVLEAGPDGSELFKDPVSKALDEAIDKALHERFFFVTLPAMNNFFKKVDHVRPGEEEARQKSLPHGELAVVLEQLGYKEAAREHYLIASRLLNIPEDKARKFFQDGMKKRKVQE
jgi:hypothetical protein